MDEDFFIGIDLGWKEKKTTGICILNFNSQIVFIADIFGKNILKTIRPYLQKTKVIAIDAPLTKGRGKGKMRLYEKFLSTKIFRKERINPIPPALMPKLCDFAKELVEKLEKRGFVLDLNLIEVFPTFVKKILKYSNVLKNIGISKKLIFQTKNQEMAFICAILAHLHSKFKTRYLGYKDGFLFLPEFSLWKKNWQKKFYQAWKEKPRLKYRYLITNLFSK